MKLIPRMFYFLLAFVFSTNLFASEKAGGRTPAGLDARVWEQGMILLEGDRLAEGGFYDRAIEKYRESLAPRFIENEMDKSGFFNGALRVHRLQGKYEKALQDLQWFIAVNAKGDGWLDDKMQLEALIRADKEKSKQPIYDCIRYYREKYKNMLPPVTYEGQFISIITSKIIYLYDHIGDADGGIAFCDEILRYWEKKSGQDLHRPGNKNQYFLIKQAFEQDKKEGFKGCLDAKPGDACMGRATKALIQSDYFPW